MQAHLEQLPARLEHLFGLSKLKYEPLDPAKSEIRLLTVVSKPDEPLRCILRKHSLDENPIYFALSYVWGNPSNTKPIIVDGCVFGATINLVEALRHLSNPNCISILTTEGRYQRPSSTKGDQKKGCGWWASNSH